MQIIIVGEKPEREVSLTKVFFVFCILFCCSENHKEKFWVGRTSKPSFFFFRFETFFLQKLYVSFVLGVAGD
jgi:hypothetical protein